MKLMVVCLMVAVMGVGCVTPTHTPPPPARRPVAKAPAYAEPQMAPGEMATIRGNLGPDTANSSSVSLVKIDGALIVDESKRLQNPVNILPGRRTVTVICILGQYAYNMMGIRPIDIVFEAEAGHAYQVLTSSEGEKQFSIRIEDEETGKEVVMQDLIP